MFKEELNIFTYIKRRMESQYVWSYGAPRAKPVVLP